MTFLVFLKSHFLHTYQDKDMKRLTILLAILFALQISNAQKLLSEEELEEQEVYTDYTEALENAGEVVILNLSGQSLNVLPKTISRFRKLQILILSRNNLINLPEELYKLKTLQVLDLDSNFIKDVPSNISLLLELEELYLGYNNFTTLPPALNTMPNLKLIDIGGNKNLDFDQIFRTLRDVKGLKKLDLSYCKLDTIPWAISTLVGLQSINLSGNPNMAMDTSLRYMSQANTLREIILADNKMRELPKSIGLMTNLKIVDLSKNDKLNMVSAFEILKGNYQLEVLNISKCGIDKLPSDFKSVKGLLELYASDNKIKALPKEISQMELLEILDISGNEMLSMIPATIGTMQSLEEIKAFGTSLDELPDTMEDLVDLKLLELPKSTISKEAKKMIKEMLPNAEVVFEDLDEEE